MSARVQQIYIALFNRPADPLGLAYWDSVTNNGANLAPMLAVLAGTPEYQDRFTGLTPAQQVNSIYQALYGRDADLAGLTFFVNQLQSGNLTLATLAVNILDGAQGTDAQIIANKVTSAQNFTAAIDTGSEVLAYSGQAGINAGTAFLSGIGADASSVKTTEQAQAAIDTLVGTNPGGTQGQTFTLTDKIDVLNGTAQNDTFVATNAELSAADNVNGAGGTDKFNIFLSGGNGAPATVKAVEQFFIQASGVAARSIDFTNVSDASQIWNDSSSQDLQVTNVQSLATVGIKGTVTDYDVQFKASLVSGVDDKVNVALDGATVADLELGGATATNEFETITFSAAGKNSIANLLQTDGTALEATKTVNVDGAGSLTVTNAFATGSLTTIDASKNTGGVSFNVTGSTKDVTFTGGTGADTIKMGGSLTTADKLNGGDGTDVIGVTEGADLVTGLQVSGFETLDIGGADADANTFDVSKLSGITTLKVGSAINATANSDVIVNNLAKGAAVEINASLGTAAADGLAINVKDAGVASPNDTIDVKLSASTAITTTGDLTIKDVETINLSSVTSSTSAITHILSNLTAAQATTVAVNASTAGLNIADLDALALVNFDASQSVKAVTVVTGADAFTATSGVGFKLGEGDDTITLTDATTAAAAANNLDFRVTGGKGADTITLAAAAGGQDQVVISAASDSTATKFDTVVNFSATAGVTATDDKLDVSAFAFAAAAQAVKLIAGGVSISGTTVSVDAASAAGFFVDAGTARGVAEYESGGTLYVFVDANKDGNFAAADDAVIALTGVTAAGFEADNIIF
ncbi:DUF4214 domain-containing protein [Salinarimonas ramus]|uniref:Hemolysin-type calcium-binding region n=1 Tax=Salinarimonas ramus TaxID=690164 RepID=A0A917QG05_9HYPH|nr:DUF4214 domain-containing protein [Salinarimonas ramus]GGK47171.1 hemolysin-type calcium-binding region [Salinarimonas ramus]